MGIEKASSMHLHQPNDSIEPAGDGLMLSNSQTLDLEAQNKDKIERSAAEYYIPPTTKYHYLGLYFALNLGLTLYNKAILGKVCLTPMSQIVGVWLQLNCLTNFVVSQFAFPWLLTTVHTGIAAIGCYLLLVGGYFKLTRLTRRENFVLFAFSLLYTINIAISNVSL